MDPISLGIGIVALVIFIITVISIGNNPNHGFFGKLLWIVVAFFLSILGSILWLIFGRGRVNR
ncbi:PLDc N-terminal domain-containing protein [Herbiconiux sp. P17]|uniref:PLDc N-terminal domain-containing protein n=1 Tax=Herbiconiux wuyangfengii TaxID=3342794 RepID=UPI0035B788B2